MPSKRESMETFRRLLDAGSVQASYRALLSFMAGLRQHFGKRLGDSAVSSLYQGQMDITYFALFPPALRERNLKIGIVFNYDAFRFEAWLLGRNRQAQRQCWDLVKGSAWPGCRVVAPAKGAFSILECDLASDFDLDDAARLTARIERRARDFIDRIERFLAAQPGSSPARVKRR